jgi:hypothetical protein
MLRQGITLLVSLAIVLLPASTLADKVSLMIIMQELRQNFLDISDGFLLDDFDRVAEGALAIAEHPRMPEDQAQQVADELGPEMAVFNNFDVQVHELSLEIYKAASERDRGAAVAAYQDLITACFDCHFAYRERVAAALDSAD